MYAQMAMWALQPNTRGSRGNDPDLERYLKTEFLGGTTLAALLRDPWLRKYAGSWPVSGRGSRKPRGIRPSTRERTRSVIVRLVTTAMAYLHRVKPEPASRRA